MKRLFRVVAAAMLLSMMPTRSLALPFEEEFDLAVRAGRGELLYEERAHLQQQGHALVSMLKQPHVKSLLELFANLPEQAHARLKEQGYLAWNFADLSAERQAPFREFVEVNQALSRPYQRLPVKGFSLEDLEQSRVGFVVVDLPVIEQRVVSWFILWPSLDAPSWVTLVNANAVGSPRYMDAHAEKLHWVRSQPLSPLPDTPE